MKARLKNATVESNTMFVCKYDQHFQPSMDQPGMVANPDHGELTGDFIFFPCSHYSRLRVWFRGTGLAVPSRTRLLILHTPPRPAESSCRTAMLICTVLIGHWWRSSLV